MRVPKETVQRLAEAWLAEATAVRRKLRLRLREPD
jgi:hypothetical protein